MLNWYKLDPISRGVYIGKSEMSRIISELFLEKFKIGSNKMHNKCPFW